MAAVMAEVGAGQRGILRARNAARDRLQASIPANYNPWLHLAATTGIGVATLVVGLVMIHAPTWRELLTIPLVFVFANAFEWRAHKDLLHHRRPPLHELYDRHTPEHHMVFGYDDMAIREPRELHRVLIPWIGVLGIVVAVAPLAWALGHFWSPNRGWLFLVCSAVYMVGYELSHTSYHLAPDSFVGRLALVRFLREHHRRHHHPRLMQRWNFNVTIPLFDWLHRSVVSEKVLAETLAKDAAEPATDAE
ncbi:MAG: fatty acid hydroxylase [Myxococcales bacterium]|nr:fatty acid hydroxylase [Myxococcales bacterium]